MIQRGGRHFFFLFFSFLFSFILERQTHKNIALRTFFDGNAGLSARLQKNKTTDDKNSRNKGDDAEGDDEGGVGGVGDGVVDVDDAGEEDGGGSYENDEPKLFPGISSFHSTP